MSEPGSSTREAGDEFRFSLRQIIALMTAVGAAFALYFVLVSPPLGSSGLSWAMLPAVVLAAALWFCSNGRSARLAAYTVVGTFFAVVFLATYISRSDWLFGHTPGPPQLILASWVASMVGGLAGVAWLAAKFGGGTSAPATEAIVRGEGSNSSRWLGAMAIVPLTLLSCLLGLLNLPSLPRAMQRMDNYIRQRQINAEIFHPSHASPEPAFTQQRQQEITAIIANDIKKLESNDPVVRRPAAKNLRAGIRNIREHSPAAKLIDTPATQTALLDMLADEDPVVRAYVAMAILELKDQTERSDRLKTIDLLGVPQEPADATEVMVMLLRTLEYDRRDEECRCAAIRALGRMGRGADAAYRQIEVISLRGSAAERAAATEALTHIGPAAGQPGAAFQIPNPQSPP